MGLIRLYLDFLGFLFFLGALVAYKIENDNDITYDYMFLKKFLQVVYKFHVNNLKGN